MPTNILIVEDEFLIALEMEEVVRDLGHRSIGVADTMEAALALANAEVDVALVDINLADGATGPLIGARLVTDYDIDVVFVTANPAQLGEGIDGTLGAVEKPVDLSILKDVLDFVLAMKRGEDLPDPPKALKLFGTA
ncbi:response regulator [Qipengyuania sp. JC766]|uniref:response regulator n=1 Tax=Qipengyuania sp. JC766 TaxID=3232139 RepID=UPI003457DD0A